MNLLRLLRQYGPVTALTVVTLVALALLSSSLQQAASFAGTYATLLLTAAGGLIVLLALLVRTLWRLIRQVREHRPGSRITLRLSLLITSLVGAPVLVIYLFALQFLYQGIDAWFDVKTETALHNAVSLTRMTLDNQTRTLLNLTQSSAQTFATELDQTPALALDRLRQLLNAEEVALFSDDGQPIAFSATSQTASALPHPPPENIVQQVRKGLTYAAIEEEGDGELRRAFYRVMIPLKLGTRSRMLQAIFPIPAEQTQLAETVQTALAQYQQRAYLRQPLKTAMAVSLTLVLLLALLSTLLFTIQLVSNFTRPIRQLTRATRRVSAGEMEPIRHEGPDNELGELIRSFNDMVRQLRRAQHTARVNHQQVEIQRAYLQAIISSLTSGVITLDSQLRIRLFNQRAEQLLGAPLEEAGQTPLPRLVEQGPFLALRPFWEQIAPLVREAHGHWQLQLTQSSPSGERILLVQGTPLASSHAGGHVVIFEDITDLVQAQRHAAWHEVAVRLAHEIKNPLTPIRLSAERLAFKLGRQLPEEERALLEKLTGTIVDQVVTMQTLVDAFADYARSPELALEPVDINTLLEQMAQLYTRPGLTLQLDTDPACPQVEADPNRLRQLLHNLIKNGIEACENQPAPTLWLASRCEGGVLTLSVCDNGPGLGEKELTWIFEPYATDKPKGTGLGLAVVKKIVEEHNGTIQVTRSGQRTCFMITLPLTHTR